ncbi:MAG: hypothetical protein V1775_01090 [Bacteroidota bacterium]
MEAKEKYVEGKTPRFSGEPAGNRLSAPCNFITSPFFPFRALANQALWGLFSGRFPIMPEPAFVGNPPCTLPDFLPGNPASEGITAVSRADCFKSFSHALTGWLDAFVAFNIHDIYIKTIDCIYSPNGILRNSGYPRIAIADSALGEVAAVSGKTSGKPCFWWKP